MGSAILLPSDPSSESHIFRVCFIGPTSWGLEDGGFPQMEAESGILVWWVLKTTTTKQCSQEKGGERNRMWGWVRKVNCGCDLSWRLQPNSMRSSGAWIIPTRWLNLEMGVDFLLLHLSIHQISTIGNLGVEVHNQLSEAAHTWLSRILQKKRDICEPWAAKAHGSQRIGARIVFALWKNPHAIACA